MDTLRFDTLEEIKRRESKRSRAIRQRHREEHVRKFAYKQQYDRAYRKALSDYQAVRLQMDKVLSLGSDANIPLRLTEEQKLLLLMLAAADKLNRTWKQRRPVHQPFIVHLFTVATVELQKQSFQTLRLMTGQSTLGMFKAIQTWGQLCETVEKIARSQVSQNWGAMRGQVQGNRPALEVDGKINPLLAESAMMLAVEVGELQELLASDSRFVFENASFLFHLQLKVGLDALGLGVAVGAVVTAASFAAAPVVLAGIACVLASAHLYNGMRDIEEYEQSWDTEMRGLRDLVGETLGTIAEAVDLLLAFEAVGRSSAKLLQKSVARESSGLKAYLTGMDLSTFQHPELKPIFEKADRWMAMLGASRSFYSDVLPRFKEIVENHPDAAPDQLIRGVLATGLSLAGTHSKAQESSFATVGKMISDAWSVWETGSKLSKGAENGSQ